MNILLLGSGGREHALAWKLRASPLLRRLFAAPGNPGIGACADLVDLPIADPAAIVGFCRREAIDLVVIGPEAPLVAGLADRLADSGIRAFGPGREAARLEGSKGYTKGICAEFGIPTAAWQRFTDARSARRHIAAQGVPIVVKADGLAAGKGVTIAMTLDEALAAVDDCFAGKFGEAGAEVIIEECLAGIETSFFALCDGTNVLPLASARDHKRVGDGDTGPNTGGMGAYSSASLLDDGLIERVMAEIVRPTAAAMRGRGAPFRGVLYAGLMLTGEGPKLIEYNVRFGDPECQALMMRLESDLLELMLLTVVMAARGYPGEPLRGTEIRGIERAEAVPGVKIFHAGTALEGGRLVAAGGRVLDVTARAPTIGAARDLAYRAVDLIDWPEGFCRRDIAAGAVG